APMPNPASTADRIGVLATYPVCGPSLDHDSAPVAVEVSQAELPHAVQYHYRIDFQLVPPPEGTVCPGTLPAPIGFLIDVGPLPPGIHTFDTRGHTQGVETTRADSTVVVNPWPGLTVSGVWYAPEQSGRGVFVNRFMTSIESLAPPDIAVIWATHDAAGRADWAVAAGRLDDNHFEAAAISTEGPALSPAPAALATVTWGRLSFEYRGCGSARLEWDALDPGVADGSVNLVQLVRPDGTGECEIGRHTRLQPAIWPDRR
ncbi:MAG TPA: hypothetical protein VFG21_05590, partial [Xanthomonadaceae bacterium]|nr:hypothetical protein [Xanthomonadaceae bacterium]